MIKSNSFPKEGQPILAYCKLRDLRDKHPLTQDEPMFIFDKIGFYLLFYQIIDEKIEWKDARTKEKYYNVEIIKWLDLSEIIID